MKTTIQKKRELKREMIRKEYRRCKGSKVEFKRELANKYEVSYSTIENYLR